MAPYLTLAPATMLVITCLGINIFGDGLREALDRGPGSRARLLMASGSVPAQARLGLLMVLFAVSILTFLIFEVIPNGNPALRLAGRTATPANIAAVEKDLRLQQAGLRAIPGTMEQILHRQDRLLRTGVNAISQLETGPPGHRVAGGRSGRAVAFLRVDCLGLAAGLHAGTKIDTGISALNFLGISAPSFVIGYVLIYLFSFELPMSV